MSDDFTEQRQMLGLAMECKECGNCDKCELSESDKCFDNIMYNSSTAYKAELMVQMYLLGGSDGLKNQNKETVRKQMPGINGEVKRQTIPGAGYTNVESVMGLIGG